MPWLCQQYISTLFRSTSTGGKFLLILGGKKLHDWMSVMSLTCTYLVEPGEFLGWDQLWHTCWGRLMFHADRQTDRQLRNISRWMEEPDWPGHLESIITCGCKHPQTYRTSSSSAWCNRLLCSYSSHTKSHWSVPGKQMELNLQLHFLPTFIRPRCSENPTQPYLCLLEELAVTV